MKTSTEIPEIYETLNDLFGVKWSAGIAIAYGDTIYSKNPVIDDVAAHEAIHIEQQKKIGKDIWWSKYCADKQFRLEQEIEAYQAQVKWIKDNIKDRNHRFARITKLQLDLSGPMYGNMVTLAVASRILHV